MNRVCVIDIPGLSRDLLQFIPTSSRLGQWIAQQPIADLTPTWPAVTCSVQATLTTGTPPSAHGINANGIATFRSEADRLLVDASNFARYRKNVSFWEQSNQFLQRRRFWQNEDGTSKYKTALLFFQNSMPGFSGDLRPAADVVLTPKPDHGPDGKLVSLCWSQPAQLVPTLFSKFGPFPLMNYWGPMAGIASSQWIAKAAAHVWMAEQPALQFVYIPHLDYDLQRFGPDSPQARVAVVDLAEALDPMLKMLGIDPGRLIILSEYAIHPVHRSIQPNRLLREAGLLVVENNEIDFAHSEAFVMADHQIGYLYSRDPAASQILTDAGLEIVEGPHHQRAGEAALQSPEGSWLDYRWWTDPGDAPPYAAMVDIHRKPGYDPLELFADPVTRRIATDPALIRGSHGRIHESEGIAIGLGCDRMEMTEIARVIEAAVVG
ncbi:MAG: alkaline phosphatase family protein [Phycisphaerae bacterium]|nr:alkaline phosphatase family protein [Phycisphaerae bacterium]